jgi:hypothetical protein
MMIDRYLDIKSLDPVLWGKCGWIFLNSIALTYKIENKENYKQFILQLPYILPCKTCGENLKENIGTLDDALKSKENFLLWLLKIRNSISKEYNRPEVTLESNINEIFSNINKSNNSSYIMIVLSIIILVFLVILYKNIKLSE